MTLLYMDNRFLNHDTGRHPESAARLEHIHARLEESGILNRVTRTAVPVADDADVRRIHTADYLTALRSFARAHGGRIETDTVMSTRSADVAWLACGAAVDAVTRVLAGEDTTALGLVRPPGHHALQDAAMGFCLLNNAAIAARTAVQKLGLQRVLIVDWDVHHGNGTQDAFYEDEHVWFFSVHRSPFYPGTGHAQETGSGAGLGTIRNLPLKFGISRTDYLTALKNSLTLFADACRPELVILSAGFDAHAADPVGSLGLETEDYAVMTRLVQQIADTHAHKRMVSLLEGGYHVRHLADSVHLHLETILSTPR